MVSMRSGRTPRSAARRTYSGPKQVDERHRSPSGGRGPQGVRPGRRRTRRSAPRARSATRRSKREGDPEHCHPAPHEQLHDEGCRLRPLHPRQATTSPGPGSTARTAARRRNRPATASHLVAAPGIPARCTRRAGRRNGPAAARPRRWTGRRNHVAARSARGANGRSRSQALLLSLLQLCHRELGVGRRACRWPPSNLPQSARNSAHSSSRSAVKQRLQAGAASSAERPLASNTTTSALASTGQLEGPGRHRPRSRARRAPSQAPCPADSAPTRRSSRHTATRCRDGTAGTRTINTNHRAAGLIVDTLVNVTAVTVGSSGPGRRPGGWRTALYRRDPRRPITCEGDCTIWVFRSTRYGVGAPGNHSPGPGALGRRQGE